MIDRALDAGALAPTPRVAVFTLTMDRLDYTKRMLDSLAASTRLPYDHYIVDNGSTDGTRDFLSSGAAGVKRVVWNAANVGISEGSNQALEAIGDGYDYIVKVDNDCEFVDEGWLEALVSVCEARGRRIVLSPRVDGLGPGLEGGHPRSSWVECAGYRLGLTTHVGGICAFAPAEVYEGYRFERNPLHGLQDVLFSAFVRLDLGYEMGYVEDVRVEHMDETDGQLERYPDYWELRERQKREFYGESPLVSRALWIPRRLSVLWRMDRAGLLESENLRTYLFDRVKHRARSLFGQPSVK